MTHNTSVTNPESATATMAASKSLSNAFWFHFGMHMRAAFSVYVDQTRVRCLGPSERFAHDPLDSIHARYR
jgi:hypothetical protein